MDINTARRHQLGVHCCRLPLHFSGMFHDVNFHWQLQPGYEVSDGGQGNVAAVTEEFPRFVAEITGLSLLEELIKLALD